MTIAQHVAAIRGLINQFADNETPYTDEFLYHLFRSNANLLVLRKRERSNTLPVWDMRYFCVGTEKTTVHDCGCIDAGCNVLKTIYEIPKPIQGKYRPYLKVLTIDQQEIPYIDPNAVSAYQYDPIRKNKIHYSFLNGHIVLWGTDLRRPKAIMIGGYFEDISEWAGKQVCDSSGNATSASCYNIYDDEYPLDIDLVDPAYQLVLERLRLALQIPDDKINETA